LVISYSDGLVRGLVGVPAPLGPVAFVSNILYIALETIYVNSKVLTMTAKSELRSTPLGLRVTPSLKSAIEKAAKDDRRSMASMAELILTDWLENKGYLEKDG
jgi:hypothetical protein